MAASASFQVVPTANPYGSFLHQVCLHQQSALNRIFFSLLNIMKTPRHDFTSLERLVREFNFNVSQLSAIESPNHVAYIDVKCAKKTHCIGISSLVDALNLETPLFPTLDEESELSNSINRLVIGSSHQFTRRTLKEQSLIARRMLSALGNYQLFLKLLIRANDLTHRGPSCFIPPMTAKIFHAKVTQQYFLRRHRELGSGTYGRVYHVEVCCKNLALKEYKDVCGGAEAQMIHEFINYLLIPPHSNLLRVEALSSKGLFLELALGNFNELVMNPQYSCSNICSDFVQIASGLNHIHMSGFNYKDLKPTNILYFSRGLIKICDFGFVALTSKDTEHTVCSQYAAPEYFLDPEGLISTKADVWSFGVMLFKTLTRGRYPFLHELRNQDDYLSKVVSLVRAHSVTIHLLIHHLDDHGKIYLNFKDPSKDLLHLVVSCLNPDPAKRPSMDEIRIFLRHKLDAFKVFS